MAKAVVSEKSHSIEYLGQLLESPNMNDKSTAIATLSDLSRDANIIQDMLQGKIHLLLMRLLSPFKTDGDEDDFIPGEKDVSIKPKPKLSPPLINEVLQILLRLVADYDFFALDDGTSVSSHSFRRIMNLLNHDSYRHICQVNIYSLLETAIEYEPDIIQSVMDCIAMELPKDKDASNAFLSLFASSSAQNHECQQMIMKSTLFNEILSITQGTQSPCDLTKIHCFEIIWNISQQTQQWEAHNDLFCAFVTKCLSNERAQEIQQDIIQWTQQIIKDMDGKWGNKDAKKTSKRTDGVAANNEDLETWSKQQNELMDKIHSIQIALDLYLQIFESQHDTGDNEEEKDQSEHDLCINTVVASLINNWLDIKFDVSNLIEVSTCISLDIYIDDVLQTLKTKQMNLVGEIISQCAVSISSSQWQCLWDVLLKRISDDNKKTNDTDESELCDLERNDSHIAKMLCVAIKEHHKELVVTTTHVDELLKLHSRVRNVQDRITQFNMKNISNEESENMRRDLVFVSDINGFELDLSEALVCLFGIEMVETSKEYQQSILKSLYDAVEMLCSNIGFVDVLIGSCEKKDLSEALEEWRGSFVDPMQTGFEIAQLILDVMSMSDEYAKLPLNKKRFGSILKLYKMVDSKWSKFKNEANTSNTNHNNKEDEISQPVEECIVNIEKFVQYI
eukprot:403445_1